MMEFFWERNSSSENLKIPPDYNKHHHNIEFPSQDIDLEDLLQNKSSFLQIPLPVILERIEKGNHLLHDLVKIFQSRVEMEDKEIAYSNQLSKISLIENEIHSSTVASALSSFQNYFQLLSQEQIKTRNVYEQSLTQDLSSYHTIYNHILTKQKSDIEKNLLQINQASAQLVKLKQQYIKLLDESQREGDTLVLLKKNLEHIIQQQSEKDISLSGDHMRHKESSLLYDRFLSVFDIPSTPEQEIERQVMRLDKLEKEKEKKRKEMEAKKTQLLFALEEKDRLWAAALKSFETAERSRLHHTERTLKQFCQCEREFLERRLNLINNLEKEALQINSAEDLAKFSSAETSIDDTHLYSHALKVMDWDYYRKSYGTPEESDDWEGSGVWIDSEGIPSEETLLNPSVKNNRDSLTEVESEETERAGLLDIESSPKMTEISLNFAESSEDSLSLDIPINVNRSTSQDSQLSVPKTSAVICVQELLDRYIFPSGTENASDASVSIDQTLLIEICRRCFIDKDGRECFLQALDDRRGRNSELKSEQYEKMKIAMKVFLDQCKESRDVKAALRIANMSITFHTKATQGDDNPPVTSSPSMGKSDTKHYLQREPDIAHNLIWKSDQFWEDSLSIGLSEQLDMMDKVRWDELDADILKEKIIAIHNMIFGQLGTIAFTMHEMGLSRRQVEQFVMTRSQGAQLGRDQQAELLKSIRATFGPCSESVATPPRTPEFSTEKKVTEKKVLKQSPAEMTIAKMARESNDEIHEESKIKEKDKKLNVSQYVRDNL